MKVLSPSKINLGLKVIYKREDGFHEIRSFFLPVDLFDEIFIERSELVRIKATEGPEGYENIVFKTLKTISEKKQIFIGADIYIKKNIPIGGGLGGASSNAATVLKTLPQLYEFSISEKELYNIASEIGSDVPFFINPKPAFVSGKGENIEFIDFEIPYYFFIYYPGFPVSTLWAYREISKIIRNKKLYNEKEFEEMKKILKDGNIKEFLNLIENDFEKVVFKEFPELYKIKSWIEEKGALKTFLTGTGSCIIGIFENKVEIEIRKGKAFWCKQFKEN